MEVITIVMIKAAARLLLNHSAPKVQIITKPEKTKLLALGGST